VKVEGRVEDCLFRAKVARGRVDRAKTSPDRRMGNLEPNSLVRIRSASVLMGAEEGVCRVRGWMVIQSTKGWLGSPMTVLRKSTVFLDAVISSVHKISLLSKAPYHHRICSKVHQLGSTHRKSL